MTQEKLSSETIDDLSLWENLRLVYRWRKGQADPLTTALLDRFNSNQSFPELNRKFTKLHLAFTLWKGHKCEDTFFKINHFKPTTIPGSD